MSDVPAAVTLSNGVLMPSLGFGTHKLRGQQAQQAVTWALEAGYRHIDTASVYKNEAEVGEAVGRSGVARESLFITSKAGPSEHGFEEAKAAFERSLACLNMSYLDLYLIHWPGVAKQALSSGRNAQARQQTWRALEEIYTEGRCRTIGVSNYTEAHLRELLAACRVPPMVNQIEVHPFLCQAALRQLCAAHRVQVAAYAPLGCGQLLMEERVAAVATRGGRTAAQVLLRWGLQQGLAVVVKSADKARIEENACVFDFELEESSMAALASLERGCHFCWAPQGVA